MEINFTVAVQMAHFFIAYVMLKKFLFNPLVQVVDNEDAAARELTDAVEQRKLAVIQQENLLQDQWRAARQNFTTVTPPMDSSAIRPISKSVGYSSMKYETTDQQRAAMQTAVKEYIEEKVTHVF